MTVLEMISQFCSGDEDEDRPYLHQPFSYGEFTYATNGQILVRVPRIEGVDEREKFPIQAKLEEILTPAEGAVYHRLAELPPKPDEIACFSCKGRGRVHDCPSCSCECGDCEGTGKIDPEPGESGFAIGGWAFNRIYIRMISELPDLRMAVAKRSRKNGADAGPSWFKFGADGVGAIMPMRDRPSRDSIHIELIADGDSDKK